MIDGRTLHTGGAASGGDHDDRPPRRRRGAEAAVASFLDRCYHVSEQKMIGVMHWMILLSLADVYILNGDAKSQSIETSQSLSRFLDRLIIYCIKISALLGCSLFVFLCRSRLVSVMGCCQVR